MEALLEDPGDDDLEAADESVAWGHADDVSVPSPVS